MKTTTRLLALVALGAVLAAPGLRAQTQLTVREVNRVPPANLEQLAALGAGVTTADVTNLLVYERLNQNVQFTGVVLSNPYNSGLASWVEATNAPGRVHVFIRDTSAIALGFEGMTTQLVGAGLELELRVGRVYTIVGTVTAFNGVIQVNPTAVQDLGPYQQFGLPASILNPVPVSTADFSIPVMVGGEQKMIPNWVNFNSLNGQYVRFENALVTDNVAASGRVNYQWQSSGTEALVNSDDISLRFRNDRLPPSYPNPPWNSRPASDPFVAPAIGAVVTVQGFALLRGFDFSNDFIPANRFLSVAPWTDADLQVAASPPIFGAVTLPSGVAGNAPVAVSVAVSPGAGRTVTSVVLDYAFSTGGSGQVPMTGDGSGVYSGQIPVAPDGAFVTFTITATDDQGASSTTPARSYRVLYGGITDIAHVQQTATGGAGASPFAGMTLTSGMNLDAVVQAVFTSGSIRFAILQDDPGLGPWTGIWTVVPGDAAIAAGNRILITAADVVEFSGLTQLNNMTFSVTGTGDPYPHKVLSTGVLNGDDPAVQEQHEGMLLRFENVTITSTNPDAPSNFGEWLFSSGGAPQNAIRGDDQSDAIPPDFNTTSLAVGQVREYMQGVWRFANNQYKLVPIVLTDIGNEGSSNEPVGPAVPGRFALESAYPNPVSGTARVRYAVGTAGAVRLAVYDVTGRQVALLVDGPLAANTYEATLDAAALAPGVYVVRLTAGPEVLTRRITVAK